MIEILFRGKAANRIAGREYRTKYKNGDWVYGLLTDVENYAGFSEMTNTDGVSGIEVDKNTAGMFVGAKDIEDKHIFEGDICEDGIGCKFVVEWDAENTRFIGRTIGGYNKYGVLVQGGNISYVVKEPKVKVIGNIHDNPELLKRR